MKIRNKIMKSLARRSTAANKQQTPTKTRLWTKAKLKPSVIAVYASTFILIVVMVFIGYQQPQDSSVVANATNVDSMEQVDTTSVDDVVASTIAANVAQAANLPVATSVVNLAISAQTKSEFAQSDGTDTTKPQLVGSDTTNRSIISYTVKAGDTIDSLMAQFSISKDTIKWANNMTSDALVVGSVMKILPVDGVIYKVRLGDTIDSIAARYSVDKTRLVLYNDLDVGGLTPNTSIILPSATLPGNERPGYVASVVATTYFYAGTGTGFGGKTWHISNGTGACPTYTYGNCTCYAHFRRTQLGLPVGTFWGNAGSWAVNARQNGLVVNSTPGAGAIIQDWGHVAIVESILPNGDLSISEMNAGVPGGGYNVVSGRVVSAGNAGQYLYIH